MVKRFLLAQVGIGGLIAASTMGCGIDPRGAAEDAVGDSSSGALDGDVADEGTEGSTDGVDGVAVDEGAESESEGGAVPQPECGNGIVEVHESCDDANEVDGDGCNADCRVSGSVVWARTHDGDAHADDRAASVAVLPDGDAIAGGTATALEGIESGWIRRYDGEGTVVWVQRPAVAARDDVAGVAIDRDGSIVACGSFGGSDGDDVWARRYSADGELAWHTEWSDADVCSDIAAGDDGRVVVTGGAGLGLGKDRVIWLAKLTSRGDHLWASSTDMSPVGDERGRAVAIDDLGRIVVAGRIGGTTATDSNVFLGRWSSTGIGPEWSIVDSSDVPGIDEARGVAIDGTTIIAVGSLAASVQTNGFHLRLDDPAAGHGLTLRGERGITSIDAVAVDEEGNVVMVGAIRDDDGLRDVWIEKRDPEWSVRWTTTIPGIDDTDDIATDVATRADGVIFVAGAVGTDASGMDAWVAALAP